MTFPTPSKAAARRWHRSLIPMALAMALLATACGGDSGATTTTAAPLSPDQIFALQTACFDANLFYDDNGVCYSDGERTIRVPAPVPGAPSAPTTVAGTPAPPTTAATGGTAAPTTQAPTTQAPAPPTTAAPGTTTATTAAPSTTTATTAPPTTAPPEPVTIDNANTREWILRLTTNDPIAGGNPIYLAIAIGNGEMEGSGYESYLEQNCTTAGSIDTNGFASFGVSCGNKGVFQMSGTLSGDMSTISGTYSHTLNDVTTEGSFTMTIN